MDNKNKYSIGFLCYDGSFSFIIKNKNHIKFDTYEEASAFKKKIQPKYKHFLEVKQLFI